VEGYLDRRGNSSDVPKGSRGKAGRDAFSASNTPSTDGIRSLDIERRVAFQTGGSRGVQDILSQLRDRSENETRFEHTRSGLWKPQNEREDGTSATRDKRRTSKTRGNEQGRLPERISRGKD